MLKQTTKALLESFHHRNITVQCVRNDVAYWHKHCRKMHGSKTETERQIGFLPYRKHLATLQSTNGG